MSERMEQHWKVELNNINVFTPYNCPCGVEFNLTPLACIHMFLVTVELHFQKCTVILIFSFWAYEKRLLSNAFSACGNGNRTKSNTTDHFKQRTHESPRFQDPWSTHNSKQICTPSGTGFSESFMVHLFFYFLSCDTLRYQISRLIHGRLPESKCQIKSCFACE